ncbi:hypothetical protein PAERUG_P54_1_London_24_VIM_2_04_13_02166 [Pseudomonas aeruginosa]|nr:hypothetical protein PAERUG_E15_London_28_01_14_06299 [Pseudomonas aeruginosa]CRX06163.1 hypothetical protein PAERUG_P54_1_London_24_VIM_2_04_13_02166 [Pseudomonas aeruginosa]
MPVRCVVAIDQPCAYPLGEVRMARAVQAHGVFQAEHLGQRQVARTLDLLPDQMRGHRAALGQGLRATRKQRVGVVAQRHQRLPGARQVRLVEQCVQARPAREQLGLRQFAAGLVFEGAKQAVKLHLGRLVPVHLHQAGEQGVLLVVEKEAVGQVEVESVAGVHLRRAQAEEQAEPAGQAGEEPAGADVWVQADADLRHRQAAGRGDDANPGTLHQPHAATHHIAVGPADEGFRVGMDAVVEAVFIGEEASRQGRYLAGLLAAGVH